MRLWIDDICYPPKGWTWIKTVKEARRICCEYINSKNELEIEMISLDHDAGDFKPDYIEFLKWLELKQNICEWKINTLFSIHSMNVVAAERMRQIIRHNGWKEVLN